MWNVHDGTTVEEEIMGQRPAYQTKYYSPTTMQPCVGGMRPFTAKE